ncbi:hypothetical protein JW998_15540 [candidate division KSB1 bacterium]|nr:hypothetical protein [candidate division KSB1 bacterium]
MKRSSHCQCIFLIVASLIFITCKIESPEQQMPIMVWYGPSIKNVTSFDFWNIREAGFNQCLVDLEESALNFKALAFADSIGLGLYLTDDHVNRFAGHRDSSLVSIDSLTTLYHSHPSFLGYYLSDKPGLQDFASISTLIDYFNSKHPSHHYFVQANPEYSTPAMLDTVVYRDYLSLLVQKLRPKFLSVEYYGIVRDKLRPEFYTNLGQLRQVSLDNNCPFWAFALLVSFDDHPQVAHSHVRVQIYAGLAYGAKGVQYYSYRPPKDDAHEYGEALLNQEGDRTPAFSYARMINAEIQQLGAVLMGLKSTGVYFSHPVPRGGQPFKPGLPIIKINSPSILSGFFENESGQKYVMFVNTDFFYGKLARIHFSENVQALIEVSKNYMPPLVIEWKDELFKDADILFRAGDGRLFEIIEKPQKSGD